MQENNYRTHLNAAMILMVFTILLSGCNNKKHMGDYEVEALIFQDQFTGDLDHWITEVVPDSTISIGIIDEQLVIDTDRGVTLWLNQELSGNLLIRYKRRVVMEGGRNDRLSDMNQFWMAVDPQSPTLFSRDGAFKEYDSLLLYYAGIGGNYNKTTRFRKYTGDGNRLLIHDLTEQPYLLKPNHTYQIEIVVKDGITKLFVDGREFFHFEDENPLTKGYFGIRATWSRQIVDDVEIFKLK
ncbi:DUF6250 domain-containing protein [Proteiniphilum sp. UBA1028]|jgi:rhamnogalacturonan endolyase|uniref:DUF6250 domain-containing protein n=1 Tax=Proteiniphilum sp. UBA1028 TaxID=1947251 RepID=UPI0025D26696|nr:DUF6250 domain-containing protein [Proteiniphilum sp. UBA1028]